MEKNFKKVKSIIHLILLGLELIFWATVADFYCIKCENNLVYMQFVDSTYGGFSILTFILAIQICLNEEFQRQTLMTVCYLGGIFHLMSAVVLTNEVIDTAMGYRLLMAMIFCILLAGLFLAEAIYITIKKDITAEV